jgi:hypothetical protein
MARQSVNLLPSYYQTDKNSKFLSSTIDQLTQPASVDRLNAYVGSKLSPNYNPNKDVYLSENEPLRDHSQLLPSLVIKNLDASIAKAYGYDDLVNQLSFYGSDVSNLDKLFRPDFYSYDPKVDWDKFVNYSQYYWLPTGPVPVTITGIQKEITSTYTIKNTDDGNFFVFTPDGLTPDPVITLYRGVTYVFNIDSKYPVYIKTGREAGPNDLYNTDIQNNGIKKGQIIVTVTAFTPNILYYNTTEGNIAGGQFVIKGITENSSINVETEILGKSAYTSASGIKFINGLVVAFGGDVFPSSYAGKKFIVENVGSAITLTDFSILKTPESIADQYDDNFDAEPFDDFPFDDFENIPLTPEYITINRSSADLNSWSRYNRWFHVNVIQTSATANNIEFVTPVDNIAKRPIIEFKPGLQLFNYGSVGIRPVDHIDNTTTDAFSKVENSYDYWVDGVLLQEGDRVIFNADIDPDVRGRIYQVHFVNVKLNKNDPFYSQSISLIATDDNIPPESASVVIIKGTNYAGTTWHLTSSNTWIESQQHKSVNQAPLFDVVDSNGYSFGSSAYNGNFQGTKIFGYAVGTGVADTVLGFPLSYSSEALTSTYLFDNYFMNDSFINVVSNVSFSIAVNSGYLVHNKTNGVEYINVWTQAAEYKLAVQQFQVVYDQTASIEITVFDNPGFISDLTADVFVNDKKYLRSDFSIITSTTGTAAVSFVTPLSKSTSGHRVLLNLYSNTAPNGTGIYEAPINLTNNPLNDSISQFTLSEVVNHVQDMVNRDPDFVGSFPGSSNLSDLANVSKYGSRFIINKNSLSFAQYFISDQEHSAVTAIRVAGDDYNLFKLNFLKAIMDIPSSYTPADAVDYALAYLNENKNITFPYLLSDMVPYGTDKKIRRYTVTDSRNTAYSISSVFDITTPSNIAILVYLNGTQLLQGFDYTFDLYDPVINVSISLNPGDEILINEYLNTDGCYISPTPSKLGLYPKFKPTKYLDNSYAGDAQWVIQGHDGSIIVAFNDYRDDIIIEFETRIFNNIKVTYNPDLFDVNSVLPGRFRKELFSYSDTYNVVQDLFIKWKSVYGVNYEDNLTYDINNHKTYNYKSSTDYLFGGNFTGSWRSIYKYYFDTDRPDLTPWEMLGFSLKPDWWDNQYGPAPYTSGNTTLWNDLEAGFIAQGPTAGYNTLYVRPGLSQVIPVDEHGNLVDIREWGGIALNDYIPDQAQSWSFGDWGPAENAWRRSSNWPFAAQILMALTKPADYSNKLFDTSRMMLNLAGQYTYSSVNEFISPARVLLQGDTVNGSIIRAAGYGVYVLEIGKKRSNTYLSYLKEQLENGDFNLMYKVGGFVSQDKLNIIVDSYNLATQNPEPFLPNENYNIHYNVSNPILSLGISGVIVIKSNGKFVVRGYDKKDLFFTIFQSIHSSTDPSFKVGGQSETYLTYTAGQAYQSGQVVFYQNNYYRVISNNIATAVLNQAYYQLLDSLPTVGGIEVSAAKRFETTPVKISYGTIFDNVQAVFDFLMGYGQWLHSQGFEFNTYNGDFNQVINWDFSAKEFLYWSAQNWANNSVITLSPFADTLTFNFQKGVVDNVLDSFYEYSIFAADGSTIPVSNISITRSSGTISIKTAGSTQGIFFARLNLVQKEHVLIFDNTTVFKDVIYDRASGYRQLRMKLIGFKTSSWNGDLFSPGFVYDNVSIEQWSPYKSYMPADVVQYVGKYYSAAKKITGSATFDFAQWFLLPKAPTAKLIPNFDYKINQFEDFYSLDIDNFDRSQQKMAQHLTGYSPRPYLDNIFADATAQYKFYQGYIKEKGTLNSIIKLEKAGAANMLGTIDIYEEWAFRAGAYGGYSTYNEIEFPLRETDFIENSQAIQFIPSKPAAPNEIISYVQPMDMPIYPVGYSSTQTFATSTGTFSSNEMIYPYAGYPRLDDVKYTFTKMSDLLTTDNSTFNEGDKVWIGFDNNDWGVYRYTRTQSYAISATAAGNTIVFNTKAPHGLQIGEYVSVTKFEASLDAFYTVSDVPSLTSFTVISSNYVPSKITSDGVLYHFISSRYNNVDELSDIPFATAVLPNELFWVDNNGHDKWAVYKKADVYTDTIQPPFKRQLGEEFGYGVTKRATSSTLFVSAANYNDIVRSPGSIFVYDINPLTGALSEITNFGLNSAQDQFRRGTGTYRVSFDPTPFGDSVFYDDTDDVVMVAASYASTGTTVTNNGVSLLASTASGVVKVSGIFRQNARGGLNHELTYNVLNNPGAYPNYSRFGASLFVQASLTNKTVLIGAPGVTNNSRHSGEVYMYNMYVNPHPIYTNVTGTGTTFYSNLTGVTAGSPGALSSFNVMTLTGQPYRVMMVNSGTSYLVNSTITIAGANFGGTSPTNDLVITVTGVNGLGNITTFTSAGTVYKGTSATFTVSFSDYKYIVTLTNTGTNYNTTSRLEITGDNLGGRAPDNNLDIVIDGVNNNGSITSYYTTGSFSAYKAFSMPYIGKLQKPIPYTVGAEFGYSIVGSRNGSVIAVSAPGINTGTGAVYIYTATNGTYAYTQVLDPTTSTSVRSNFKNANSYQDRLGSAMAINDNGTHLFVASSNMTDGVTQKGKVGVYEWNGNNFEFLQLIDNPAVSAVNFGQAITVTPAADSLVITGQGNPFFLSVTFDGGKTTFDNLSCQFGQIIKQAGSAYLYERYNKKFVFVQELINSTVDQGGNYGFSAVMDNNTVYVGNPDVSAASSAYGSVHIWNKISTATSYSSFRNQSDLVDLSLIDKSFTVDTLKEQVVDYLDIVDPVKGRLAGLAEQELKFKTPYDPAFYNRGTSAVVVDEYNFWESDHVGEVWWDLSTVKYVWYEQGETLYRKNAWGKQFPGSSIDVYEWVETTYTPSQWATLSNTSAGSSLGITGYPKFADDSVYSSKQIYDSGTGQFTTLYYYWVKNKTTVPSNTSRKISASEVASIINDPVSYGLEYVSILGPDSVAVVNYKSRLIGDRINLNLGYDSVNTSINKHTEWILIQENNRESLPTPALTQKLFDSLIGHDSLGNRVPDPSLSKRQAYGIEYRPRQSMFVDRIAALRNLMDFTNNILLDLIITDNINFDNLNNKDEIPNILLGQYDQVVEDKLYLDRIVTNNFITAELSCEVTDGRITAISILNTGFGYLQAPTVTISDGTSSAKLKTVIDSNGSVVHVDILDRGNGFVTAPALIVRPYTVILNIDPEYNGKWSRFEWTGYNWLRAYTQSYDTTKYWTYIDWKSSDFNSAKPIAFAVDYVYETAQLSLSVGDYVKVQNGGNGNYIILRKIVSGSVGTFDADFDIVYSQNGTIKILDTVWNTVNTPYAFDEISAFDQTLFDQTPDIELASILKAIKDDLFTGDHILYWNQFFFAAVKYALTEQRSLDWVFKTSFVNVINQAGVLDQRTNYRFQDPTWYNDYINEIKPYHTKIRNYQVNYNIGESNNTPWDPSLTYNSDFDLPSYFDSSINTFTVVTTSSELLLQYPYKSWNDNHKYSVESISVGRSGDGYREVPVVTIIPAPGDTGSGATAQAYISNGGISFIKVLTSGQGYTVTPTVLITGGGNATLTTATAYAQLTNGLVRNNFIRMKFDRISTATSVGATFVTTTATTNGNDFEFDLDWAASPIKTDTSVYLNGLLVLKSHYTITNYTSVFNSLGTSYKKHHSKIALNYIPPTSSTLIVNYKKNIELYSAADRIRDYYNPTSGMFGKQLSQLMYGAEFPGTTVQGLDFSADYGFGDFNFGDSNFADAPADIFSLQVTTLKNTQTFVTADVKTAYLASSDSYVTTSTLKTVSTGTPINVYLESWGPLNPSLNSTTNVLLSSVRIDGASTSATNVLFVTPVGSGTAVSVTIPGSAFSTTASFSRVVFRTPDQNAAILSSDIDTVIDGGNVSTFNDGLFTTARGISPSDIIVDGRELFSPITSYAPEEVIPGQVQENLSIDVFTQEPQGSPLVITQLAQINGTTSTTVINLDLSPPSTSSVIVSYNSQYLTYGVDYSLDFAHDTLTLNQQTSTGILSITTVGVGGINLLGSAAVSVTGSFTSINSRHAYDTIGSIYVTVNGQTVYANTSTSLHYSFIADTNNRGLVNIYGMSTGTNLVQAWFFGPSYKAYSELKQQIINVDNTTSTFNLIQIPGVLGPFEEQTIVEVNGLRINPPDTTYYQVSNNQTSFVIHPNEISQPGIYSLSAIKVFRNGIQLNNSRDFLLEQPLNTILFNPNFLSNGDVLAIETYNNTDYSVDEKAGTITLTNPVNNGDLVNILTFTNGDASGIRTERFYATEANFYTMQRPILNENYIWVSVAGKPLIKDVDYAVSANGYTVQISINYQYNVGDIVLVTSINDTLADKTIGFKIFKDILGRTQFKRFSKTNSTSLARSLSITDTEIYVNNAGSLSTPNIAKNQPGVIFINSERIEFMTISGNVLSRIKRATLGTGANTVYSTGTTVVDMGIYETVPSLSKNLIQNIITTNTTTYNISAVNTSSNLISGDGININPNITSKNGLADQVEVYYAGILLNKTSTTYHYSSLGFDTGDNNSDIVVPPEFTINYNTKTGIASVELHLGPVSKAALVPGSRLTIIQRTDKTWYTVGKQTSLLEETTPQAAFLQSSLSGLPDKYQYEST